MRTISVELGSRTYPIHIGNGLLESIGARVKELGFSGKVALVTNPTVYEFYGDRVVKSLASAGLKPVVIKVPDGEEYKNLDEVSVVYDALIENRMERNSPIIALGGGVIGDMAGFVAATYLRGVPFIQVPTTLLAQVDSSVGGKTGVNHPKGKNLIGAFYQPRAVFIDPWTLHTLEARELKAGLAEVVKYGVIWDAEFFSFLEANAEALVKPGTDELTSAIERSCEIKAEVVSGDETEQGRRAILNYGHTFGHAIEALSGYGKYKHGEAVAMGMAIAAELSSLLGLCKARDEDRIKGLLRALGLPVDQPDIDRDSYIDSMRLDKKVSGGLLRFVLVSEIGKVVIKEVDEGELGAFLG